MSRRRRASRCAFRSGACLRTLRTCARAVAVEPRPPGMPCLRPQLSTTSHLLNASPLLNRLSCACGRCCRMRTWRMSQSHARPTAPGCRCGCSRTRCAGASCLCCLARWLLTAGAQPVRTSGSAEMRCIPIETRTPQTHHKHIPCRCCCQSGIQASPLRPPPARPAPAAPAPPAPPPAASRRAPTRACTNSMPACLARRRRVICTSHAASTSWWRRRWTATARRFLRLGRQAPARCGCAQCV